MRPVRRVPLNAGARQGRLFGNPEISGAQISPDGQFIAFIKPYKDTRNVWVKKTHEPFSASKLITADTKRPIPGYFWSRDSQYVLFVQDQAGDENYNVYAVKPADNPVSGQNAPQARNLTAAKGVRALIYDVPKEQPDTLYVGLNDRDAAWHDLYKVNISTGERSLVRKNTEKIAGWLFDNKGQLRLATRTDDNGNTEILRVDADGFKEVYSCTVFETCGPIHFHPDNNRVYMTTNKGEPDLTRLTLFDVESGAESLVESDPLNRVDFSGARFSVRTDELLVTLYEDDRTRRYFKNTEFEAVCFANIPTAARIQHGHVDFEPRAETLWLSDDFMTRITGETQNGRWRSAPGERIVSAGLLATAARWGADEQTSRQGKPSEADQA
jgi:hypothetical protein